MRQAGLSGFLLAVALLAAAGWCLRGYITDDTFIHLRYAENLLERGEFSFNPGVHAYGATSPLWIFGLALLLFLGVPPLAAAWVLGAGSGLLTVAMAWAVLRRLDLPPSWRTAALLVITGDVWFLRWTFSGMETPLATALLLVLVWPLARSGGLAAGPRAWSDHLAWGAAAGLAALVRPEFMIIAPAAWPWLAWAGQGGTPPPRRAPLLGRLSAAAAGWILVMAPWLVYAKTVFGRLTPGTASAKSASLSLDPGVIAGHLIQSLQVIGLTQGTLWLFLFALLLILSVGIRRAGGVGRAPGRRVLRSQAALIGIAVTWSALLMGGYAVKQVWIISRYISPLGPVLLLAAVVIARLISERMAGLGFPGRVAATLLAAAAALTLAINGLVFTEQVVPHARTFPAGVRECYLGMGEWIRDHTPPDAVVAALDIGAVGYASERRVLDLMGLVSPEILDLGAQMGFQEMVASGAWLQVGAPGVGRPDYFVDRSEGQPRWAGKTAYGVRFELLDTCQIAGVGLREPQLWTVALYRLIPSETRTNPSEGG